MSIQTELERALARHEELLESLSNASTAEVRAQAALELYEHQRGTLLPATAAARRAAVRDMRALGYSLKECGEILGVTDARIAQITGS